MPIKYKSKEKNHAKSVKKSSKDFNHSSNNREILVPIPSPNNFTEIESTIDKNPEICDSNVNSIKGDFIIPKKSLQQNVNVDYSQTAKSISNRNSQSTSEDDLIEALDASILSIIGSMPVNNRIIDLSESEESIIQLALTIGPVREGSAQLIDQLKNSDRVRRTVLGESDEWRRYFLRDVLSNGRVNLTCRSLVERRLEDIAIKMEIVKTKYGLVKNYKKWILANFISYNDTHYMFPNSLWTALHKVDNSCLTKTIDKYSTDPIISSIFGKRNQHLPNLENLGDLDRK